MKLIIGSMILSCFMTVHRASAQQDWSDPYWGGTGGTNHDNYVINQDHTNNWSSIRLQTADQYGWTMVNQGHLWWGFAGWHDYANKGAERMTLTTGGDLSIAGAFTARGSGDIRLVHNTGNSGTQRIYVPGNFRIIPSEGADIAYVQARREDDSGSTQMRFRTSNNGVTNEAMHIDSQGNVGIGNLSPSEKLEVSGNIVINGSDTNQMRLYGTNKQMAVSLQGITPYVGTNSNDSFSLMSNNQYRMTVSADGDVGIGITTPSAKLDVDGTGHFSGNVGIGTVIPSAKLDVDGTGHFSGQVGIGVSSPSEKLEVSGNIKSDGVILNIGSFPDYVFEQDYPLMPLGKVESYIKANKHLPGFPSEAEVVRDGANLGRLNNLLVEKVEELTLYTIEQSKQISELSRELTVLKAQLGALLKKQ